MWYSWQPYVKLGPASRSTFPSLLAPSAYIFQRTHANPSIPCTTNDHIPDINLLVNGCSPLSHQFHCRKQMLQKGGAENVDATGHCSAQLHPSPTQETNFLDINVKYCIWSFKDGEYLDCGLVVRHHYLLCILTVRRNLLPPRQQLPLTR
jgi:hypothetical protein